MKVARSGRVVAVAGAVAAAAGTTVACGGEPDLDVERVVAAYDSLAARAGWPGFEGGEVPLIVFDGTSTWLLRHPDPPADFRRHEGRSSVWIHDGRHPAVAANTSVDLGGFRTAVVVADSGPRRPAEVARTLVHEAFHVHQGRHRPDWSPNEVELFTYPIEDAELLRWRRLETTALRRALRPEAPDSARRVCWLRAWLGIRTERASRLPEGAITYERKAELLEGLARYVESVAAGEGGPEIPARGYAPEAVRSRAYDVGHALGWLLDRTAAPDHWKERLAAGETATLEAAVAEAVDVPGGRTCRLTPDETARALAVARADLETLADRRAERRRRFESAPGWRIEVVAAEGTPLLPEAFDPQNVDVIGEGLVLHGRWLRLAGAGGAVEVLNREALSEAAGPHPLFTGVRRLLVTGIRVEPEVERDSALLRLRAEGFEAELPDASLVRSGRSLRVELSGGEG